MRVNRPWMIELASEFAGFPAELDTHMLKEGRVLERMRELSYGYTPPPGAGNTFSPSAKWSSTRR